MGLEGTATHASVRIILSRCQCCLYLLGMMGVVVDNRDPFRAPPSFSNLLLVPVNFKSPLPAASSAAPDSIATAIAAKGIVYIMLPLDSKTDPLTLFSPFI